ncbi:hypothetical protein HJC23_001881 [Cyclotella cryptica]|uniref:Uncharacterized protein n=1 Tax=Cyclotella cryptica TaxID=29204 RepID=A0ABD3PKW9_9STRA
MDDNANNPTPSLPRTGASPRQIATATPERFDEAADAEDPDDGWVFPDPGAFPADTPTLLARTRGQQRILTAHATTTPARNETMPTDGTTTPLTTAGSRQRGQPARHDTEDDNGTPPRTTTTTTTSALIKVCTTNPPVRTPEETVTFLQWQASRRGEAEEQKRFRDDAAGYPHLLVFAAMRKKSPHIHLVHSVGIYPNIPGADKDWCGKCIGFLGNRTGVATPQAIELGRSTAWGWEDQVGCVDGRAMDLFFAAAVHSEKWWTPDPTTGTTRVICPRMLALPPDCVVYCAQARRTPWELSRFITSKLRQTTEDPTHYQLLVDWCCLASQPGTGTNANSSLLSFVTPAILGTTEHFHAWAHARLLATLGPVDGTTASPMQGTDNNNNAVSARSAGSHSGQLDVGIIAQVTAAVVAALRAESQVDSGDTAERQPRTLDAPKPLSDYQLAKLKGFSCVRSEAALQPIWQYFRSTKEVDAQRTQLLEEMKQWARGHDVQLNRSVYFDDNLSKELKIRQQSTIAFSKVFI